MIRNDAPESILDIMRSCARDLSPIPTGHPADPRPIPGLRAVIFDLYGTLFISEAGDISHGSDSAGAAIVPTPELSRLMAEFRIARGMDDLASAFKREVLAEHRARSAEEAYPEIVAERLWSAILGVDEAAALRFAAAWEASVNKAASMPGAAELLRRLRAAGLSLGIVSNAQAYTPLLFPLLLGSTIEEFGFDPELIRFSWKEGRGKPSLALFESVLGALAERGVEPSQTLFVGNDMLKDLYPARKTGMRTCLFAGDERSLRLRADDPRCAFAPDASVVALGQIARVAELERNDQGGPT